MSKIKILQWVLGLVGLAALAGIVVDTCCDPEKPAGPSGPPEPQIDKPFPRVVTLDQTNIFRNSRQDKPLRALALDQTNIIHDIKQDKTLRAIAPLFAGAMRGKTPRARAGKGLLGIGALGLSTWLRHKADENRKEAEEIAKRSREIERREMERDKKQTKINGGKEDGLEMKYTVDQGDASYDKQTK